ncbi:LLM class flavin-dependent oxidoreductase [Egicoccus sp. AB-alg2]|uniref:LLM class flavin-dependent oxidoreductase n=1 Tax=Egicoccus sp. AB-alg2 TaxID=3242693 RepID=UPI00359EE718
MRLGFAISGKRTAADALEVARRMEAAGIDEVWITEDYFERGAFALAGAILAATSRVRLGIGVVNPWTRHPVLTAMETAALQELAPGRVVLGLGASNARWMQEQLGIPFEQPLRRLGEAVELVRAGLRGDPIRQRGLAGTVDARLSFTAGDVPIVLGVKGPRALDLARHVSDGVLLSVLSAPAYVAWARQRLGSELDQGISSYVAVRCDDDRRVAREAIRSFVASFLGVHGDHAITRVAGLDPQLARAFTDGLRAGAPRADLVTEDHLDVFVAAGDRDDVAGALHRHAEAGLDRAVIFDQPGGPIAPFLDDVLAAAKVAGLELGE